jgi:hypothetical protein
MYYIGKLPNFTLTVLLEDTPSDDKPVPMYKVLNIKSLSETEIDPSVKSYFLNSEAFFMTDENIILKYDSLEEAKKKFEEVTKDDFEKLKITEIKIEMPKEITVLSIEKNK